MENDLELQKLKIQKFQLYLQFASVIISGVFVYLLLTKDKAPMIPEDDYSGEIE